METHGQGVRRAARSEIYYYPVQNLSRQSLTFAKFSLVIIHCPCTQINPFCALYLTGLQFRTKARELNAIRRNINTNIDVKEHGEIQWPPRQVATIFCYLSLINCNLPFILQLWNDTIGKCRYRFVLVYWLIFFINFRCL